MDNGPGLFRPSRSWPMVPIYTESVGAAPALLCSGRHLLILPRLPPPPLSSSPPPPVLQPVAAASLRPASHHHAASASTTEPLNSARRRP
uniref:Uncharacterized protein n=1 Tax=Arundo donax TaxID=35708 RepID=A0A0A9DTF0_ARUDO